RRHRPGDGEEEESDADGGDDGESLTQRGDAPGRAGDSENEQRRPREDEFPGHLASAETWTRLWFGKHIILPGWGARSQALRGGRSSPMFALPWLPCARPSSRRWW